MTEPIRVAIVGGGCGAMTAAYELSKPEHHGRYQITVYQDGWRLGGKGASGRGMAGRIEEHGLHVWLGFYENAFAMIRDSYGELQRAGYSSYGEWDEAFIQELDIGLFSSRHPGGGWQKWAGRFSPRPGLPGDPIQEGETYSLRNYFMQAIQLLRTLILDVDVSFFPQDGVEAAGRDSSQPPDDDRKDKPQLESILDAISRASSRGMFTGAIALVEGLGLVGTAIRLLPDGEENRIVSFVERLNSELRFWLEKKFLADDRHRHIWEIVDLVLAVVVGTLRFNLLSNPSGLDVIDQYECREWLRMNGASERALNSPFLRGLYDLQLSYEDGDMTRPALAAGQSIRGTLRMFFGYRGSLFWRMRAGMGDVVFAPLYTLLKHRGVKFEFFHRLTNVAIPQGDQLKDGERTEVISLTFGVQAEIIDNNSYQPLVHVAGHECWPSQPVFSQLIDGESLRRQPEDLESHWNSAFVKEKTLHVGQDFDAVVLGVSIGAVPFVCQQILARDERWRAMVENVKTVASQAFQIWLKEDADELGWQGPPYIFSGYQKPFDTWCDMAHVIPEEEWEHTPKTAFYFCGVLPDPETPEKVQDPHYPASRRNDVHDNAKTFLATQGQLLWPKAYDSSRSFRWSLLAAEGNTVPSVSNEEEENFDTQYWRANVNPSDRYVLTLPGSNQFRISPLDMTYTNMTIAGDWTDCGFNAGCTEAAVMSGRLAAHAISGSPALEEIVAYDHP